MQIDNVTHINRALKLKLYDMAVATACTENRQILDWARAIAALAVCVSHVRNLSLQDYVPTIDAAGKAFYFVSNYGHAAVIVFFVLSGFFVGGSVVRACAQGRFTWNTYLMDRGTRLWVVLLPALVATFLWDKSGIALAGGSFYTGTEGNHDQTANVATQLGFATFVCNASFLQTIACSTYGSNGPLWSLANEFWYYLCFPVLLSVSLPLAGYGTRAPAARRSRAIRLLFAIGALVTMSLKSECLEGFAVWLLGAAAAWLENRRPSRLPSVVALPWLTLALFAGLLVAMRFGHVGDLAVGAGFFVFLLSILWRKMPDDARAMHAPSVSRLLALGPFLSRFSYSLYLTHMPLIVFICACAVRHRLPWSALNFGLVTVITAMCYFYAYGFYWAFESRTVQLRAALLRAKCKRRGQPVSIASGRERDASSIR